MSSQTQSLDERRMMKREQLADLLLNKFRNMHSVHTVKESQLDAMIKSEITRFVMPSHGWSPQEKDINRLDNDI
jgi:hypothetical protein